MSDNVTLYCGATTDKYHVVRWYYGHESGKPRTIDSSSRIQSNYIRKQHSYHVLLTILNIKPSDSGEYTCKADNRRTVSFGEQKISLSVGVNTLVPNVDNGFSVDGPNEVEVSNNVTLYCGATADKYDHVRWYYGHESCKPRAIDSSSRIQVNYIKKQLSYHVLLTITNIKPSDSGDYICKAQHRRTISLDEQKISLSVVFNKPRVTVITGEYFLPDGNESYFVNETFKFKCVVMAYPAVPAVKWFLKNCSENSDQIRFISPACNGPYYKLPQSLYSKLEQTGEFELTSTLTLSVNRTGELKLLCDACNTVGCTNGTETLRITEKSKQVYSSNSYSSITMIILVIALILIAGLYIRKLILSKRPIREDYWTGLLHFEQGCPESLNPNLDVIDQAEFLPYDKHWEFPREKILLGKKLGSGEFGLVLKAEAFGLREPDVATVVAVKMVKRTCDILHIRALISELKIMIHLGKHVNVVSLLGACTGSINNRELLVMIEYCCHGNLRNYILQHKDAFINQINPETGKFDSKCNASSPRMEYANLSDDGDQTEDTNSMQPHTHNSLVAPGTSSSVGEDGYLVSTVPEWKYNYTSDYNSKSIRPIFTQDLLCWGFQVARGMEYLASRKVLHGDLAARNTLLTNVNVVKICDFGFSKNMYKDYKYHKESNDPLPIKWMSIEAIQDRVFSIQSDVWAYGIVLWEFFSLAQIPYPGMQADEKLFNKLKEGYRMDKPEYATNEVYKVMLECWHKKPSDRPSFSDLAEKLGSMLEKTIQKHYIDINDANLKWNAELFAEQDYLSKLKAPTFSPSSDGYISLNSGKSEHEEATELIPMMDAAE